MTLEIVEYTTGQEEVWEQWCKACPNATMLHSRRFLNYHGSRFQDTSVLVMESGELVGILPAARDPNDIQVVVSHPGITYGGVLHQGWLCGERMIEAFSAIQQYYRNVGIRTLRYKALPYIYATVPSQDDLYALYRHGARRIRCDISSTIDLSARREISERRKRGLKKAQKNCALADDSQGIEEFWAILEGNLANKHNVQPVHSLKEMEYLRGLFPHLIKLRCATIAGRVEAGALLFVSGNVWHAQYIAASALAYQYSALDLVFDSVIQEAKSSGVRYFDFGISTEQGGSVLNMGLYKFKSEFGGGGVVHEFYELEI